MARVALAVVAAAALLVGCESTQEKAAKLQAEGSSLAEPEPGLTLERTNRDVKVVETAVLQDQYGTAVVAELRNTTDRTMVGVPVAIDVRGADGASLYVNDAGGIDASLTTAPLLPAGKTVAWVNNQVNAAGKPQAVDVKVGEPQGATAGNAPEIEISGVELREDSSGPFAHGVIANRSKVVQKRLTVYAVARKHGGIVAAGRAVIDRLDPDPTPKPVRFTVYFIGNPKGAELTVSAPPVQL